MPKAAMLPHDIPLENASNLRDLGGWPTQDGRRVRTGLVLRAPALTNLSPADQARLAALNLRTVCDLRGTRERALNPVVIPGATSLSLPIEPSVGAGLKDILRTGQAAGHITAADMLGLLAEAYRAYALQSFLQYRALFAQILRPDGPPLLLHCTAGKDRTGFGAALLLTALGVAREHVMADYLATNRFWRRESAHGFDMPDELKDVLFSANPSLLETAFDAIDHEYGSVDIYLDRAISLDRDGRARLAERLLES